MAHQAAILDAVPATPSVSRAPHPAGSDDEDFASASSGSQRSESPSPHGSAAFSPVSFRTVSSANGGRLSFSGGADGIAAAAASASTSAPPRAPALRLQSPGPSDSQQRRSADAFGSSLAVQAIQPLGNGTHAVSIEIGQLAPQHSGTSAIEPALVATDAPSVSPTQSDTERLLPRLALPPLQVSGKKVRRVTWAAGVVSPRPRARRRKRRCEDVEAGGTCASFLLPCPPDDGEAEGFGAARLARTGAAALALWAHRCSCIVLPLLLLRLGMAPHGSQRLTRVPAEHATMPGAVQSAGGAGGTASQHSGASGGGHGNPLLLVALLALAAATACAAFGERLRTWTARQPRAVVVRRACAAHAAAGCVAAALLACACNLAPPLYRRTGSGVGLLEGVFAVGAALVAAAAAPAVDALLAGVQRDWLWELLGCGGTSFEPWPREQDVAQGLAACQLGGSLTGGLLLLCFGPTVAAAAAGALHAAAWLAGAALLTRFRVAPSASELELTANSMAPPQPAANGHANSRGHSDQLSDAEQQPQASSDVHSGGGGQRQQRSGQSSDQSAGARRGGLLGAWHDLQAWAEQPAAPAAAAAALFHASVLDLGVLTLAFLALRGVPVAAVAAAAAAGGVASALGGAIAPALSAKVGGLLPCGLVAAAAHGACLWLAVAPLLAEALHGSGRRWTSDVVFAAAAAGAAMTRAAFGAAVQHLMERWQEGGDAGEYSVVGSTQRRLVRCCAAVALAVALAGAGPATLPWLMAASAAVATAAVAVFASFAAAEWKYCQPGGSLAPVAPPEGAAAANEEGESEYLIS